MKKITDILKFIPDNSSADEAREENNRTILMWGGLLLSLFSCVLTVLNFCKGYWFMFGTTTVLTIGMAAAGFAAYRGHLKISRSLVALLCAVIFSIYAVIGGNEGFAILWIILIPVLSMILLDLRMGFMISAYFQLFLVMLFYTPLSSYVKGYYTQTFLIRFPILYFTSFVLATFLMCERYKLHANMRFQAYNDILTGLHNRQYANKLSETFDAPGSYKNMTVIIMDINGLKATNDNLGHGAGDELIAGAAAVIKSAFGAELAFRMGGDEFMVISNDVNIAERLHKFESMVPQWHGELVKNLAISIGTASRMENPEKPYEELMKIADGRMYQDKKNYYCANGRDRRSSAGRS